MAGLTPADLDVEQGEFFFDDASVNTTAPTVVLFEFVAKSVMLANDSATEVLTVAFRGRPGGTPGWVDTKVNKGEILAFDKVAAKRVRVTKTSAGQPYRIWAW